MTMQEGGGNEIGRLEYPIDVVLPDLAPVEQQLGRLTQRFDQLTQSLSRVRDSGQSIQQTAGQLGRMAAAPEPGGTRYTMAGAGPALGPGTRVRPNRPSDTQDAQAYVRVLGQQLALTNQTAAAIRGLSTVEAVFGERAREATREIQTQVREAMRLADALRQANERSRPENIRQATQQLQNRPATVRVAGQQYVSTQATREDLERLSRAEGDHLGRLEQIQRSYDRVRDAARNAYREMDQATERASRFSVEGIEQRTNRSRMQGLALDRALGAGAPPEPPARRYVPPEPVPNYSTLTYQHRRAAAQRALGSGRMSQEQFSAGAETGYWPGDVLTRSGLGQRQWPPPRTEQVGPPSAALSGQIFRAAGQRAVGARKLSGEDYGNLVEELRGMRSTGSQTGAGLVEGLAQGVSGARQSLRQPIGEMADVVEAMLRQEFETGSPSRRTRRVGQDVAAGLVEGIQAGTQDVRRASEQLAAAAAPATARRPAGRPDVDIFGRPIVREAPAARLSAVERARANRPTVGRRATVDPDLPRASGLTLAQERALEIAAIERDLQPVQDVEPTVAAPPAAALRTRRTRRTPQPTVEPPPQDAPPPTTRGAARRRGQVTAQAGTAAYLDQWIEALEQRIDQRRGNIASGRVGVGDPRELARAQTQLQQLTDVLGEANARRGAGNFEPPQMPELRRTAQVPRQRPVEIVDPQFGTVPGERDLRRLALNTATGRPTALAVTQELMSRAVVAGQRMGDNGPEQLIQAWQQVLDVLAPAVNAWRAAGTQAQTVATQSQQQAREWATALTRTQLGSLPTPELQRAAEALGQNAQAYGQDPRRTLISRVTRAQRNLQPREVPVEQPVVVQPTPTLQQLVRSVTSAQNPQEQLTRGRALRAYLPSSGASAEVQRAAIEAVQEIEARASEAVRQLEGAPPTPAPQIEPVVAPQPVQLAEAVGEAPTGRAAPTAVQQRLLRLGLAQYETRLRQMAAQRVSPADAARQLTALMGGQPLVEGVIRNARQGTGAPEMVNISRDALRGRIWRAFSAFREEQPEEPRREPGFVPAAAQPTAAGGPGSRGPTAQEALVEAVAAAQTERAVRGRALEQQRFPQPAFELQQRLRGLIERNLARAFGETEPRAYQAPTRQIRSSPRGVQPIAGIAAVDEAARLGRGRNEAQQLTQRAAELAGLATQPAGYRLQPGLEGVTGRVAELGGPIQPGEAFDVLGALRSTLSREARRQFDAARRGLGRAGTAELAGARYSPAGMVPALSQRIMDVVAGDLGQRGFTGFRFQDFEPRTGEARTFGAAISPIFGPRGEAAPQLREAGTPLESVSGQTRRLLEELRAQVNTRIRSLTGGGAGERREFAYTATGGGRRAGRGVQPDAARGISQTIEGEVEDLRRSFTAADQRQQGELDELHRAMQVLSQALEQTRDVAEQERRQGIVTAAQEPRERERTRAERAKREFPDRPGIRQELWAGGPPTGAQIELLSGRYRGTIGEARGVVDFPRESGGPAVEVWTPGGRQVMAPVGRGRNQISYRVIQGAQTPPSNAPGAEGPPSPAVPAQAREPLVPQTRTQLVLTPTVDQNELRNVEQQVTQTVERITEPGGARGRVAPIDPNILVGGAARLGEGEQQAAAGAQQGAQAARDNAAALGAESEAIRQKLPFLAELETAERATGDTVANATDAVRANAQSVETTSRSVQRLNPALRALYEQFGARRVGTLEALRAWQDRGFRGLDVGMRTAVRSEDVDPRTGRVTLPLFRNPRQAIGEAPGEREAMDLERDRRGALAETLRSARRYLREATTIGPGEIPQPGEPGGPGISYPPLAGIGGGNEGRINAGLWVQATQERIAQLQEEGVASTRVRDAENRLADVVEQAARQEQLRLNARPEAIAARLQEVRNRPVVVGVQGFQVEAPEAGTPTEQQMQELAREEARYNAASQAANERVQRAGRLAGQQATTQFRVAGAARTPAQIEAALREQLAPDVAEQVLRRAAPQAARTGGLNRLQAALPEEQRLVELGRTGVNVVLNADNTRYVRAVNQAIEENQLLQQSVAEVGSARGGGGIFGGLTGALRDIDRLFHGASGDAIRFSLDLFGLGIGISVVAGMARLLNQAFATAIGTQADWERSTRSLTAAFGEQAQVYSQAATVISRAPGITTDRQQLAGLIGGGAAFAQQYRLPQTMALGGQQVGIGEALGYHAGRLSTIFGAPADQVQGALEQGLIGQGEQLRQLTQGAVNITPQALAQREGLVTPQAATGMTDQQIGQIWLAAFPTEAQQRADLLRQAQEQLADTEARGAGAAAGLVTEQERAAQNTRRIWQELGQVAGSAAQGVLTIFNRMSDVIGQAAQARFPGGQVGQIAGPALLAALPLIAPQLLRRFTGALPQEAGMLTRAGSLASTAAGRLLPYAGVAIGGLQAVGALQQGQQIEAARQAGGTIAGTGLMIAGGALGSLIGPEGTMLGAAGGQVLGQVIGQAVGEAVARARGATNAPEQNPQIQQAIDAENQRQQALRTTTDAQDAQTRAINEQAAALTRATAATVQMSGATRGFAAASQSALNQIQGVEQRLQAEIQLGQAARGPFYPLVPAPGISAVGPAVDLLRQQQEQDIALGRVAGRPDQSTLASTIRNLQDTAPEAVAPGGGTRPAAQELEFLQRQIGAQGELQSIENARALNARNQAAAQDQLDQLGLQHQRDLLEATDGQISRQQELTNLRMAALPIESDLADAQLAQQRIQQQIQLASRSNLDTERAVLLARQAQLPVLERQSELQYRQTLAGQRIQATIANLALGRQANVAALPGLIQEQFTAGLELQAQAPEVTQAQQPVTRLQFQQQGEEITRGLDVNTLEGARRSVEDRVTQDNLDLAVITLREGAINREVEQLDAAREAQREKAQLALLDAQNVNLVANAAERDVIARRDALDLATQTTQALLEQLAAQNLLTEGQAAWNTALQNAQTPQPPAAPPAQLPAPDAPVTAPLVAPPGVVAPADTQRAIVPGQAPVATITPPVLGPIQVPLTLPNWGAIGDQLNQGLTQLRQAIGLGTPGDQPPTREQLAAQYAAQDQAAQAQMTAAQAQMQPVAYHPQQGGLVATPQQAVQWVRDNTPAATAEVVRAPTGAAQAANPQFQLVIAGDVTVNSMDDVETAAAAIADQAREQAYTQARQFLMNTLNSNPARNQPTLAGARMTGFV